MLWLIGSVLSGKRLRSEWRERLGRSLSNMDC